MTAGCGRRAQLLSFFLGGALVLAGATLCGCAGSQGAWTAKDSWYSAPPRDTGSREWQELEHTRIHPVIQSREAQAEELLDALAILEITEEQAAQFAGGVLPAAAGTQPYLVRGVYLNRETGSFSVYSREDQLLVYHRSLGRSGVPMQRQALVLQLEHRPTDVVVTCSMAE